MTLKPAALSLCLMWLLRERSSTGMAVLAPVGVSIEVLIVDWAHIEAAPPDERADLLEEAAFGQDTWPNADEGWTWPTRPAADWYASYEFSRTLGSYKPHFWAGEQWERLRDFANPQLRGMLDRFASVLFWHGLEYMEDIDAEQVPERSSPWPVNTLMWSSPIEAAELKLLWECVSPQLEALREPFDRHVARPEGWINDFDSFLTFLEGWNEVVTAAHARGWGIVGLRC
ncbi:hypothetical protein [Streptomyces sp. NPDC018833]|uniref:hypothetical protein n=1 Tax=Streptomyces sp. NPDC018833 TaxID=3365053 RepID=UPI003798D185